MIDRIFYVLVGAVVGWLLQQYRLARSEEATTVAEHIKDLEKLSEAIQDYWLRAPASEEDDRAAAARVRLRHAATTLLYPLVEEICDKNGPEYRRLSLELFRVGLGGSFESRWEGGHLKQSALDPERAIEAADLVAQTIHLLRLVRMELISVSRLWSGLWKHSGKLASTATEIAKKCRMAGRSCLSAVRGILTERMKDYRLRLHQRFRADRRQGADDSMSDR